MKRYAMFLFAMIAVSFVLSLAATLMFANTAAGQTWMTAPRHSAGIAPDPQVFSHTAIVQVYAARTYGWRGLFAVHPWIIYKREGETRYTRFDVVSWAGSDVVQRDYAIPDGLWYGATPKLLVDQRGHHVETLIGEIESAIAKYPYSHTYRIYPGPNSNTFLAHIGRQVPELGLDLPPNAIGKDYRPLSSPVGVSPTGKGVQLSLAGLLGVNVGFEEGIELNVIGLDFGLDINRPALRLPFVGRVGFDDVFRQIEPSDEGSSTHLRPTSTPQSTGAGGRKPD